MNGLAVLFFIVLAIALLAVRRKYAPVPLLLGCCYITMGQGLELGSISLHFYRLMLLVGFIRVLVRGERLDTPLLKIDKLLIALCLWNVFASFFHENTPGSGPIYALGTLFNLLLTYFLIKIWCRNEEELVSLIKVVAFMFVPLSLEMLAEQYTGKNWFSVFGGVSPDVHIRNGELRAQGPFRHPILAGTVGATCLPLMIGIWHKHRIAAIAGIAACLMMVGCCSSSGPILSVGVCVGAIMLWRFRHHAYRFFYLAILGYIVVDLISSRRGYHLVTRLDMTGSSTAYYRARIIDTTIEHFSEWWMFGTDRTMHWIPSGIGSIIGGKHMDITNYYIAWGVNAGFLAVILLVIILFLGLKATADCANRETSEVDAMDSEELDEKEEDEQHSRFLIWCVGAGLLGHVASSFSIAYFDQSQVFFWLNVALVSSISAYSLKDQESDEEEELLVSEKLSF